MNKTIRYLFQGFTLDFNVETGGTLTIYQDGSYSGCEPVPEDSFHGDRLGIPPEYHRLAHELAHHLIGIYVLEEDSSPVVAIDARLVRMTGKGLVLEEVDEGTRKRYEREETLVTALTYYAFHSYDILKEQDPPYDDHPLIAIAAKTDLDHLAAILDWLLEAPVGSNIDLRNAQW